MLSGLLQRIVDLAWRRGRCRALESPRANLSYSELLEASLALASQLRLECAPGDIVVVAGRAGPLHPVSFCACLWSGLVYWPLDIEAPEERIDRLLSEVSPTIAVLAGRFEVAAARVFPSSIPIVYLDSVARNVSMEPEVIAERLNRIPTGAAYLIYTSGSTGSPLPVLVGRASFENLVTSINEFFDFREVPRVLAFFPQHFDGAVLDMAAALMCGGTLVFPSRSQREPGPKLATFIAKRKISFAVLPPTALSVLPYGDFPALRQLAVAGERCPFELALTWARGRKFYNLYGLTETTVWAAAMCVDDRLGSSPLPIGKAIRGTQLFVLDKKMQHVRPGEEGDLYVGGDCLALGYLGHSELESRRFPKDPRDDSRRLVRTGDKARIRQDGTVIVLGRTDRQINLHGHRIEPAELEAVLEEHSGVFRAVVELCAASYAAPVLVAFYEGKCASGSVQDHLRRRLPRAMVPARVIRLPSLPLTNTGKIDVKALAAIWRRVAKLHTSEAVSTSPAGSIVQEIMGVAVPATLRLVDAGMDSLAAVRIAARLESRHGVSISSQTLFSGTTIDMLDVLIARRLRRVSAGSSKRGSPEYSVPTPLTAAQERVWAHQVLEPYSNAYNAVAVVEFRGNFDLKVFRLALADLIMRHDSLRMQIRIDGGQPVQDISGSLAGELPFELLRPASSTASTRQFIQERVSYQAGVRFDLTRAPLIRWELIQFDELHNVLIQAEHHLIHDGCSFQVILEDLMALYDRHAGACRSPMGPARQITDVARTEATFRQSPQATELARWWAQRLEGLAPETGFIVGGFARPPIPSRRGARIVQNIDGGTMEIVNATARAHSTTEFVVLLSCFSGLLRRYVDRDDICVGIATANRDTVDEESVVGMLVNAVPLRVALPRDLANSCLIARVRDALFAIDAGRRLPFQDIVAACGVTPDLSRNPLFQVMFGYHAPPRLRKPPVLLSPTVDIAWLGDSAKFDLTVTVVPARACSLTNGRSVKCAVIWEFSLDLYDHAFVEGLADSFVELVSLLPQGTDKRTLLSTSLKCLSRIDGMEVRQPWEPIPAAILSQSKRTPAARAIQDGDRSLSYRQMLAQSQSIALQLEGAGVQAGDIVAVLTTDPLLHVTAAIAAWRRRAAYLLLDPAHPPDRRSRILETARVACVVSSDTILLGLVTQRRVISAQDLSYDALQLADFPDLGPEEPAYAIVTSGSTSEPRPVLLSHGSLANLVRWHMRNYSVSPGEAISQIANPGFDAWAWEVWPALCVGARICVVPNDIRADPFGVDRLLREENVRSAFLPTGLAQELLTLPEASTLPLRRVLTGGDRWTLPLPVLPYPVVNHYGLSETAVVVTAGELVHGNAPHIGVPIDNVSIDLVDSAGRTVPRGAIGEIVVSGAAVGMGYLEPATKASGQLNGFVTAEQFTKFFTGDYGRMRSDGVIVFLGRRDERHKIRGHRVELSEIEYIMNGHPEVKSAVAWVDSASNGGKLLKVAYVPTDDFPPGSLLEFLKTQLPAALCPSSALTLSSLPLTANGKVDRRKVASLTSAPQGISPQPLAHTYAADIRLIWQEILQIEIPLAIEDFFELGGDSLKLARVKYRLERDYPIRLSTEELLNARTITALAELVNRRLPGNAKSVPIGN